MPSGRILFPRNRDLDPSPIPCVEVSRQKNMKKKVKEPQASARLCNETEVDRCCSLLTAMPRHEFLTLPSLRGSDLLS
ncbi:unnamed protein product [Pieris macdunnoughi]|uniref:Uncharacterized protein n=1 Tax=Pieris macdunnoughi TaxID=345717 RepID=A0A821TWP2_9NEOP|nr:unnamed protein product [Pieris macdunnoughi]